MYCLCAPYSIYFRMAAAVHTYTGFRLWHWPGHAMLARALRRLLGKFSAGAGAWRRGLEPSKHRGPKDHVNIRIPQTPGFLVSPSYWALEPEFRSLVFVWSVGSAKQRED